MSETVQRIEALMERRGWNKTQTAAYLGVPPGTLGNWMAGTREPNAVVSRLLDVLGTIEALAPGMHEALIPK